MTIRVFMAEVCDHSSDKGTRSSAHDVSLAFCLTTTRINNTTIRRPEIDAFLNMGYSPIAVLRFDPSFSDKFSIYAIEGLPVCLLLALSRRSDNSIQAAMNWLAQSHCVHALRVYDGESLSV
jgi:hypothetical protein